MKGFVAAVILLFLAGSAISACAVMDMPVMHIGSKSDPRAHLFSYDQMFRESMYYDNYNLSMSAYKEFESCSRLSTRTDLRAFPDWSEIVINANFTGIGRMGYVVYDDEGDEPKEEMALVTHMFIGNFTLDEHIKVAKDRMYGRYFGFLGPV